MGGAWLWRVRRPSGLTAVLVCGIGQFGFPLASIAAIILGHKARRQIRRTGDDGYGLATAGLVLGDFFLALAVLVPLIGFVASASVPRPG